MMAYGSNDGEMMIHFPFTQAYRSEISITSNIAALEGAELWKLGYDLLGVLVCTS